MTATHATPTRLTSELHVVPCEPRQGTARQAFPNLWKSHKPTALRVPVIMRSCTYPSRHPCITAFRIQLALHKLPITSEGDQSFVSSFVVVGRSTRSTPASIISLYSILSFPLPYTYYPTPHPSQYIALQLSLQWAKSPRHPHHQKKLPMPLPLPLPRPSTSRLT